jgi:hypothetical protein
LINLEGVGHDCNPSAAALRLYSHGRNDHSHRAGIDHPHRRNTQNTVESAFSLLKRGIVGNFHKVSIKHLQRYLNEFSYRFNRWNDDGAFLETVRRLAGFKPLPFDVLTSEKA